MPITAGVSAGGSLLSGILGSSASKSAASQEQAAAKQIQQLATTAGANAGAGATAAAGTAEQGVTTAAGNAQGAVANATNNANTTLGSTLTQQQGALAPYLSAGGSGLSGILNLLQNPNSNLNQQFSFDPTQIANNPDYQFQLQQGLQATQRALAASGQTGSGGEQKALTQYSQGLASNEIGQAYNQALSTFNTNRQGALSQLQGYGSLAGIGQQATGQNLQALQNYGNLSSNNTLNAGLYTGNTGIAAANTNASLGTNAAQYAGNANLQAAQISGQAIGAGASAGAAGTVGAANAWQNTIGSLGNLSQFYGLTAGGYGQPGGNVSMSPMSYLGSNSTAFENPYQVYNAPVPPYNPPANYPG